jgi:hypothetical protein
MQLPKWKSGLHDVYILRDKIKTMWFKVGMTGKDLDYYRKQICYHVYGRRSHDKI